MTVSPLVDAALSRAERIALVLSGACAIASLAAIAAIAFG
jgi:hypothetical protein